MSRNANVNTDRWMSDNNGSIFIKNIPNHMDKTQLRSMFDFLGKVSRVDVVNIGEGGSGRRAFIHYSEWNDTDESWDFRIDIADSYPVHFQMPSEIHQYTFSVTLNSRPIPQAELNPQQLSDWSQRLNDELNDFKTMTNAHINGLSTENAMLRNELENIKAAMSFFLSPPIEDGSDTISMVDFMDDSVIQYNRANDPMYDENMDEIQDDIDAKAWIIDIEKQEEELVMFDLDSVEAGLRRHRDPMIFERSVSSC